MSIVEALFRQLPIGVGAHVVDVGFGNSEELATLATLVGETGLFYGIESSRDKAERSELTLHLPNVRVRWGDASRLPLSENSCDFALFKGSLHEVKNIRTALLEAKRVCRERGTIAIIDFSPFPEAWLKRSNLNWLVQHPWKILGSPPDLHAGFGREAISNLLEEAGLKQDKYEDNALQGRFYGHAVQMFLSTSIVRKDQQI